jgi:hypothetical protein
MGLTTRGDGTGAPYQVSSSWWNEYKDALTGVMTSQAFTLNYRPGSGTTPTLTLDGDGFGSLIKGLKTDHSTTAFSIDSSGNLTLAGSGSVASGLSFTGGRSDPANDTTVRIIRSTTASTLDVVMGTSGFRFVANSGSAYTAVLTVDAAGVIKRTLTLGGSNQVLADFTVTDGKRYQLIEDTSFKLGWWNQTDSKWAVQFDSPNNKMAVNGQQVLINLSASGSGKVYVQSTTPSSPADGDIWIDTSIDLG